jgi:hypothetical protein
MRILGLVLLAGVLLPGGSLAEGCHRYSIWRYPWPQGCNPGRLTDRSAAWAIPPARVEGSGGYEWSGEPLWSVVANRIDIGGLR